MRIDLHTHSAVSDGTDSPTLLALNAHAAGLDVIALTDHDTFDGVAEAAAAGRRVGLSVLTGVELSAEHGGASVHVLAYGADPRNRALADELAVLRQARAGRVAAFAERITELGMPLSEQDIMDAAGAAGSIGRPHVADAMVTKGYVATRSEAFETWLGDDKPGFVHRYATPVEQALELIHGARGAAVLAHPWGRGSREVLTAEVITRLTADHDLDGIEVDHQDHDQHTRQLLSDLAVRLGLVRTGSSDYHGLGKLDHPLGVNLTRPSALGQLRRAVERRGGRLG